MSGKATGWVLRNGPRDKTLRAVMVAVADVADARGEHSHAGLVALASRSLCSKATVCRSLVSLVDGGWLEVEQVGGGRGLATSYRIAGMSKQSHGETDSTEKLSHATEETVSPEQETVSQERSDQHKRLPTVYNGKQLQRASCLPESSQLPEAQRLCAVMASLLEARGEHVNGQARSKAWLEPMERMLRIDGRDPVRVERCLRWLDSAPDEVAAFWRPNIRSPKKLREKWQQMEDQVQRLRGPRKTQGANVLDAFVARAT